MRSQVFPNESLYELLCPKSYFFSKFGLLRSGSQESNVSLSDLVVSCLDMLGWGQCTGTDIDQAS